MEAFIKRLKKSTSPFHAVEYCKEELQQAGYKELCMEEAWNLEMGEKYYVMAHGSSVIAFVMPKDADKMLMEGAAKPMIRIACAHTDFPCFRVKTSPDVSENGYGKVNVEAYGGAILNTWLDRPLGVSGRVALASENVFCPKNVLFDSKKSIMSIPNVAIHMNRDVNKGVELNKQVDLLPLATTDVKKDDFMKYLAKELSCDEKEILDYELSVYNCDEPAICGLEDEMLSSPRIDNISSLHCIMSFMTKACANDALMVGVGFDHEEIGSRSNKGADSLWLKDVLEKIFISCGWGMELCQRAIYQGMMLSVDVAHAIHPNHPEKCDITSRPQMNQGFCIKEASSQAYATDCEAIAIVQQLAIKNDISYQKFMNRSDIPGGGTLGSLTSSLLPMKTVDIGVPILAMHSAREMMGIKDLESLTKMIKAFYEE